MAIEDEGAFGFEIKDKGNEENADDFPEPDFKRRAADDEDDYGTKE